MCLFHLAQPSCAGSFLRCNIWCWLAKRARAWRRTRAPHDAARYNNIFGAQQRRWRGGGGTYKSSHESGEGSEEQHHPNIGSQLARWRRYGGEKNQPRTKTQLTACRAAYHHVAVVLAAG